MFHVKHEWGGWVGEVDYLASTMSSPGVIEGLVFHVKRGSLFKCLEMCDPVFLWLLERMVFSLNKVESSCRVSCETLFHVKHCFM